MNNKSKNIVVTISFLIFIIAIFFINIIKADTEISLAERRKLQQFPKFSVKRLLNRDFFEEFENYTMDQFLQREMFRKIKTTIDIDIFKKHDSHNIYEYNNKLIEQIYPLNEKSVNNITNKINEINQKYLNETNKIYYTIVPDKNYFVNDNNLKLDYQKLQSLMFENLKWAKYIDIFDCLDLSCYYATDSHWKQEYLSKVAEKILINMGETVKEQYEEKKIVDFRGVYSGQFPINTEKDEIKILTNEMIENCIVYNYETENKTKVYDIDKKNSLDKYDIYLSGAVSLLTIENPKGNPNKKLVVFRDSYASSLLPLLIEEYSNITVIDTRYISPKILDKYVEFENKDILFIYSTLLINNSVPLK